ncbi:MAG: hypothetical protein IPP72_03140 [Chitinophagaceae bacterium]|nr:hypothetical protein [Chitinophagaceae bacterium]
MQLKYIFPAMIVLSLVFAGCSKKHQPQTGTAGTEKPAEKKLLVKKAPQKLLPKVITVDDRAAKKSVDGRLYYDLDGRRYWRNYDDGKYYLFNKSMYGNPAFTPH